MFGGCRFSLLFLNCVKVVQIFYVTYSSPRPLLALSQDWRFGRLGISSHKVSKQESLKCVFYFALFSLFYCFVILFIALNTSSYFEHVRIGEREVKNVDFLSDILFEWPF